MVQSSAKQGKILFAFFLKPLILSLVFCLAAFLILKFLGPIIGIFAGAESDFAKIFGQLRHQTVLPPFLIIFVLWAVFFSVRGLITEKRKTSERAPLCIVITVLFGVVLFFLTLLLTTVNSVRFIQVLRSLLSYIRKGLLSKL